MNPVHEWYVEKNEDVIEKTAGLKTKSLLGEEIKSGALRAGVSALSLLGVMGAMEGYDSIKNSIQKARGFNKLVKENPDLGEFDKQRLKSVYNATYTASPTVAMDPLSAGDAIRNMMQYGETRPALLRELGNMERSLGRGTISPLRQELLHTTVGAMSDIGNPMVRARLAQMKQERDEVTPTNLKLTKAKIKEINLKSDPTRTKQQDRLNALREIQLQQQTAPTRTKQQDRLNALREIQLQQQTDPMRQYRKDFSDQATALAKGRDLDDYGLQLTLPDDPKYPR